MLTKSLIFPLLLRHFLHPEPWWKHHEYGKIYCSAAVGNTLVTEVDVVEMTI